jgi:hypothetical protein
MFVILSLMICLWNLKMDSLKIEIGLDLFDPGVL